ncbi:hypothetical protein ACH5RR_030696 [Cinchona calisaya]|uniref:Uncharacterized protein n=1 Tax=Cinchona calisaya TaxID=153742 RepID=A0ABD2YVC9_9GENT
MERRHADEAILCLVFCTSEGSYDLIQRLMPHVWAGQEPGVCDSRNREGQILHSIVLGTFNVGECEEHVGSYIGAASEMEVSEKKDRVTDASNAKLQLLLGHWENSFALTAVIMSCTHGIYALTTEASHDFINLLKKGSPNMNSNVDFGFVGAFAISMGKLSVPIVLDLSCDHVENIKARMEKLKARREKLRVEAGISETGSLVLPSIVVNENGSTLEVNLMSGLNNRFKLHEILRILEEEGARVLSANYSTSRDRILYTICSQAFSSRIGIDTSRVQERLKRLIISPAMTRRQLDRAGREKDTC